jgi:putative transposase
MSLKRLHRRNYNIPGHAHELTFGCYKHYPFLKSDRTCRWLADAIDEGRAGFHFDLWAYVFMPDHVHLIINPKRPSYDIAEIRKAIKHTTSKIALAWVRENHPEWIPRLTRKRGRRIETLFWQSGGGYDRNITAGRTLMEMIDYIHLNPVRRGLVTRPEDWQWSSASHYLANGDGTLIIDPIPPQWLDSQNLGRCPSHPLR